MLDFKLKIVTFHIYKYANHKSYLSIYFQSKKKHMKNIRQCKEKYIHSFIY